MGRSGAARRGRRRSTPRDRALATRLAYGAVQRRATLDHVIETLAERRVQRLEPAVLAALRLGVFQLVFLDRVPAHAAVGESVELAKPRRRAAPASSTPSCAAPRARRPRSSPRCPTGRPPRPPCATRTREWIAELWWDALGADAARALMAADNEPAEAALRANTLRIDRRRARGAAAGRRRTPPTGCPRALVLDGAVRRVRLAASGSEGLFMPQSRAAMAVARAARARSPASACSTCAPRPAARPPTSPR